MNQAVNKAETILEGMVEMEQNSICMLVSDHINAPINVKPQGGEGWQTQGNLHFHGSQSQIPQPQAPAEGQILAPRLTFFP